MALMWPPPGRGSSPDYPEYATVYGTSMHGGLGDMSVVSPLSLVAAYTSQKDNDRIWDASTNSGGAITVTSGEAVLSTGTTAGAYARLMSRDIIPYYPGHANRFTWSARFPDGGVAGSQSLTGPWHTEGGFSLGYNGTSLGVRHLYDRLVEIRSLQLTAAATGAETATITLNGTAHNVSLTGGGTVQDDAREIANFGTTTGYADSTSNWDAYALDDTVYFLREVHGSAGGSYSYSSTGTSTGSFSSVQTGANGTASWVSRADWDDPLDGTGVSGLNLDFQYGHTFMLTSVWHGYGSAQWWVSHPSRQDWVPFYFLKWGGETTATKPIVADPRFPIGFAVESDTSTTDISIAGAAVRAAIDGAGREHGGGHLGAFEPAFTETELTVETTEIPVLSILCAPVNTRLGCVNRRRMIVDHISIANTGATKDVRIKVYIGTPQNLTGYIFRQADADAVTWVDDATHTSGGSTAITGTMRLIHVETASPDSTLPLDLEHYPVRDGETLIITAVCDTASTTIEVDCDIHVDP